MLNLRYHGLHFVLEVDVTLLGERWSGVIAHAEGCRRDCLSSVHMQLVNFWLTASLWHVHKSQD